MAKRLTGKALQDHTDAVLMLLTGDDTMPADEMREHLMRLADRRGLIEWREVASTEVIPVFRCWKSLAA